MTAAELRAIRLRLGWSQARMAHELGITVRSLGRYERGERRIPEPTAIAIRYLASRG